MTCRWLCKCPKSMASSTLPRNTASFISMTSNPVFACTRTAFQVRPYSLLQSTSGIIGVNKRGQVLSVSVDEQAMVPYILNVLNNTELAVRLARRANLPGTDDLYVQQFNQLFVTGQHSEAAKIAANSLRVRTILVSTISHDADLIFHTRASCAHRKPLSSSNRFWCDLAPCCSSCNTSASSLKRASSTSASPSSLRAPFWPRVVSNYQRNG